MMLEQKTWMLTLKSLRLSPREGSIVELALRDMKEATIASQLGISLHTVHTHMERVYRKLAVRSRAQLVLRVMLEYLSHSSPTSLPVRAKPPSCSRQIDS
jgi:DNA-binding CsgD family transcriptional regulator